MNRSNPPESVQWPMKWPMRCALLYTVLFGLWYLATSIAPNSHWLLGLSTVFGSWLYVPLWILLLWGIVRRGTAMLLVLLIPLALFGYDYGNQFLPRWSPPVVNAKSGAPTTLRVISWNAYFRNSEPSAFVDAVRELQPDLIAIQEINATLAATAQSELSRRLPYQVLYPTGSASGMGFLSRYPIVADTPPDFLQCNCQVITIEVDGQPVTVISIHPWPPDVTLSRGRNRFPISDFSTTYQDSIFDAILDRIEAAPRPLLVLGDMNTSERQPNYRRIHAQLHDAFAEAGWGMGYTFPTVKRVYGIPVFPVIRIDYIFHDERWRAEDAWVGTIPGADHRYVAADLTLLP